MTSLFQRHPPQLHSKISSFYSKCATFLKVGKFLFSLIGNMDGTPVLFDMVPNRLLVSTGKK